MTSTPHFALAQHPETGEWAVYEWFRSTWLPIEDAGPTLQHATRERALYAAYAHKRRKLEEALPQIKDKYADDIATLDRLIEAERTHPGEAQVQTITKLGGAE